MKVVFFLCAITLAKAGIIGTDYAPASAVSTVYSSLNAPVVAKAYSPVAYRTLSAAPVYESVLSTHESRSNGFDGSQHTAFGKSLDTPFASIKKFDSRTTSGGLLAHTVPVYSSGQVVAQPHATFGVAAPVVHTVPSSVTYSAHPNVVAKTIATPAIATYSAPVVTKTIAPGLSAVHGQPAVKITYSEAPLVSHMTFTGLGTSYSW